MPESRPLSVVLSERAICNANLAKEVLKDLTANRGEHYPRWNYTNAMSKNIKLLNFVRRYGFDLVTEAAQRALDKLEPSFVSETVSRLEELSKKGNRTLLVSSTPRFILRELCDIVPVIDDVVAPQIFMSLGQVADKDMGGFDYRAELDMYLDREGVEVRRDFCFGTGFSDVPLMETFSHKVAVNPSGKFADVAVAHNWGIIK